MNKPRGFLKTIYLDTVFNRRTQGSTNHWLGSQFKGFAVVATSDSSFSLSIAADPQNGFDAMPIRDGMYHNYKTLPNDACFENDTPQAGKWVKLWISTEDELTSANLKAIVTSKSIQWEGATAPQSKVTIDSNVSEILDSDDNRNIARFQFKSGTGTLYVGTPAELNDADFANICHEVKAGDDFEIIGSFSQSAKCIGGTNIYSRRKGIN